MELNLHLINIQGMFTSLHKSLGDFSRIKYVSGSEMKVNIINKTLHQYLTSKEFIDENKYVKSHKKELVKMLHYLIINTQFKKNTLVEVKDYCHLINTMPQLSVCILANIITELDLTECCCSLITTLPHKMVLELLEELSICLKCCHPNKAVEDTDLLMEKIICIIPNCETEDEIDSLTDISLEMLKYVSMVNSEKVQDWKRSKIHQLMGWILLHFFRLIRKCPIYVASLSKILNELIELCVPLVKLITIDIFCDWAEIPYNGEPLQLVVAGEAYFVIEYLQKHSPAQELIQLLGCIAKKPKTLQQIIHDADLETIIDKINENNDDQIHWFKAFVNSSQVFKNKKTVECLKRWTHLCTEDDVTNLLKQVVSYKEKDARELVLKCARQLSVDKLNSAIVNYFNVGYSNQLDMGLIEDKLTILLNKLENETKIDENTLKDFYLLLLQNSSKVLKLIYKECLKSSAYTECLKDLFKNVKCMVEVSHSASSVFQEILQTQPPSDKNIMNYKILLNVLIELSYFNDGQIIFDMFQTQLQQLLENNEAENLGYNLKAFNAVSFKPNSTEKDFMMFHTLLKIAEKFRWQFFTFNHIHVEIIQEVIFSLRKFHDRFSRGLNHLTNADLLEKVQSKIPINKYYIANLYSDVQILSYIYSSFSIENYAEAVSKLMKLLPTFVTTEWICVAKELDLHFGYKETIKLLTDILVLLCQITKTQENIDNNEIIQNGLKFCLHQYGIVIKDVLQPKYIALEDEVLLTKTVCSLLKEIPQELCKTEGLSLIRLFSDQSLQYLKDDRSFVISLVVIEDSTISQILAERMLS